MFGCSSEHNNEITETLVYLDICRRGWRCSRGGRDWPYDLIVDRGHEREKAGLQRFDLIQVKYLDRDYKLQVCTRKNPENEPVSVGGKSRNNSYYADNGITYLAAVNHHHQIFYYHYDVYSKFDKYLDIRVVQPCEYPSLNKHELTRPIRPIAAAPSPFEELDVAL